VADCRHADPAITKHLQPQRISQAAAVAALNHSANFFDGWLNVLDKRRQQVLGMIAATDGLSATAPQGILCVC
jgi:aspartate aminotransferase